MKRSASILLHGLPFLCAGVLACSPARSAETGKPFAGEASELLWPLDRQDVVRGTIFGTDQRGIPRSCRADTPSAKGEAANAAAEPAQNSSSSEIVPAGMRSWECIPGVIRRNGTDTFRVEVDANGSVNRVILDIFSSQVSYVSGPPTQILRDDGLNGDRVAGDCIYISEPLRYNGGYVPDHFLVNPDSPAGLYFAYVGNIFIVETSGVTNRFLITPEVGLIETNIGMVESVQIATNIVLTPHLVNIRGTNRQTQASLRALSGGLRNLTIPVYSTMPDAFDFFVFFSMDHVEYVPDVSSANFISGIHRVVQVNYTGTGMPLLQDTASWGGGSRLLGLICLDTAGRGVWSYNLLHEITHQWASFTSSTLGLNKGDSHYKAASSVNSPVGGRPWFRGTNGQFYLNCWESAYRSRTAPPLDKYMMGLIPASEVSPLFVHTNGADCSNPITNYITVTIADIQAAHGVRTPALGAAHKDFRLGFVAESFNRWLTPIELTFYDILADHATKPIPAEGESPRIEGWVSIDRYFGEGTTWSSDVLGRVRPVIHRIEPLPGGGAQVSGAGHSGRNYRLLRSTNLWTSWIAITNGTATTNGTFTLRDSQTTLPTPCFYRVTTP